MKKISALAALALPLLLAASAPPHLELVDSHPKADAVVEEPPTEIWLRFSVEPDMEQTSFSVRGPGGAVELGEIAKGEGPEVIRAALVEPMEDGEYILSWVGAPADDHPVRGRYTFTITTSR